MIQVNDYFMKNYADYTLPSNVGRLRPSNIWTRAVYYEGLMALYAVFPKEEYYRYAYDWAAFHKWDYRNGATTRNADDYCAGQTYIDLYRLNPDSENIRKVKANLDMLVNTPANDDWTWVDAIQMGMPVFAKLGRTLNEPKYYDKMWNMYEYSRNKIAGRGLFNAPDGLWWRDAGFLPPYKEPNGKNCYWSRGNGWVYAALVRVLNEIPANETHRNDYVTDFLAMTRALKACQRKDGFWNVSLLDESNFGGKELTGTSLFVYGMAWGINNGILNREEYLPLVLKAWNGMTRDAVHENGFLGYVQGTGKEPKDGQPVTFNSVPDFEDYGVGCFLLAGTEVYKLKN
ncbi:MAG TPA: glycoside hydrolase family 88 protein [Bacteroidales bacterium]|nr:glycoside hydrolase family 88 protein [Bacteroidales bacterium]